MAFKRYITVNGKKYGPYTYKSYRDKSGRVKNLYYGKKDDQEGKIVLEAKKPRQKPGKLLDFLYSTLYIPIVLGLLIALLLGNPAFIGLSILNFEKPESINLYKTSFMPNETLSGDFSINLRNGELIPSDAKVLIEIGDYSREMTLSELFKISNIDLNPVEGDFYSAKSQISGFGEGYGFIGLKTEYPEVDFELNVIAKENNSFAENTNESITNPIDTGIQEIQPEENISIIPEENITILPENPEITPAPAEEPLPLDMPAEQPENPEEIPSEQSPAPAEESTPETAPTPAEEIPEIPAEQPSEEQPQTATPPESNAETIFTITGNVISELMAFKEGILKGTCTADSPFVQTIGDSEAVLIPGSVKTGDSILEDSAISVNKEGNEVSVKTSYSKTESGFGEDYLTNDTENIGFDISNLNISLPNEGIYVLKISFSYEDSKIMQFESEVLISSDYSAENLTAEYSTIEEDPKFDAIIDSAEYDNETKILTIIFHHDANQIMPVSIAFNEASIDYSFSSTMAGKGESITLTVSNWDESKYFEIKVGEHSEIVGFGNVPEYDVNAEVKDAEGNAIDVSVEFEKPVSKEIKKEISGKAVQEKVKKGKYNIKIKPESGPVKEIAINEVNINSSIDEMVSIETDLIISDYVQSYAIDPTVMNEFTSANVTVTASGTELWKCKEWNFAEKICFGEWIKMMDIVPGQDYTFTLTAEDPALAESGGTFFDGFESGSLETNNWTNSGTSNWAIASVVKYAGAYSAKSAQAVNEAVLETSISTLSYENIQLSFYARTILLDSGEYISCEWYNGTAWTSALSQTQTISDWTYYSYTLGSSASNNPNFKIRFRCLSDGALEICYIDNVNVSGTAIAGAENIAINETVKDASGEALNVTLEINDENNVNKYNQTTKNHFKNLLKGKYKIKIIPKNHKIKQIEFSDMNLTSNITNLVDIDDPSDNKGFSEIYAINPLQNNTNATVTATASANATALYKCKSWNFTSQECEIKAINCIPDPNEPGTETCDYEGGWTLLKDDLVPGEEYTFTLTSEDPGFAEGSPSSGTPDSGSITDNNANDEEAGTYVNTQADDSSYYSAGETSSSDYANSWVNLVYDISTLGIESSAITNLEFQPVYCHSGENTIADCDGDDVMEKSCSGDQDVRIYNFSASSWVDIGDLRCDDNENKVTSSFNVSSGFADYVDSSNNIQVRYKVYTNNPDTGDAWLAIDYAPLFVTYTAYSIIQYDSSSSQTGTGALSFSHTIGNYQNRVLIVGTGAESSAASVAYNNCRATSVTYGGVALTKINGVDFDDSGADDCISLWYLLNPAVGTASIQVSVAGTVTESNAGGISLYNVSQTAPENQTTNYCTSCTTIATNIKTLTDNAWVVDAVASGNLGGFTADSGQTERYDSGGGGSTAQTAGSTKSVSTAGITSLGWSQAANRLVHALAAFAPYSYVPDATPPASVSNLNNKSSGQTWIYWNWTNPADADFNSSIIYLDNTNVANTSNNYYNATGLTCETSHTIKINTKDNSGNVNYTNVNSTAFTSTCPDTSVPVYSNIIEPTDPSTYSAGNSYQFNATWTDNIAVSAVILEFSSVNYTISGAGNVYNKTFNNLAAGTYNYRWFANDTSNNRNSTSTLTYTINAANAQTSLAFDKTSPQNYGTAITPTCSVIAGVGTAVLTMNGNTITSGNPLTLGAGAYNFNCSLAASANYSAASNSSSFTINQLVTTTSVLTNPASPIVYGTASNFSCSNSAGLSTTMTVNSVNKDSEKGLLITRAAGAYTVNCSYAGNANYSASSQQVSYTINKLTTTMALTAVPSWTEIYGAQTTVNCSANNAEVTPNLYRNSQAVSIPDIKTLGAGNYNYICNASASENYSSAEQQSTLTINKAATSTQIYLNNEQANKTIIYGTQSNATAVTNTGSLAFYRNGQVISTPDIKTLAVGAYNYTAINSGNENYTGSSAAWFLTVNKASSGVNLLLNGNDNDLPVIHDRTVNISAYRTAGEGNIKLYENNNLINSGINVQNITSYHALGLKNITLIYEETENYTASSETHFINVTNIASSMDSISISPETGKLNVLINVTTINANDLDNDDYILRCGSSSGVYNLCNSSSGTGERSCAFNSPWNDNSQHTIYCKLDDTIEYASERTAVFTADNTAPSISLISVDGDTQSPYWDTSNNAQTIIAATTETNAQCRYGTSDVIYSSMSNDCSVSTGNVNCNLGNVAPTASTIYHVSCKDQYGNEQSNSENLDVTFGVDYTAPTTYDNYDGSIKLPGHSVTIHEEDAPPATIVTTWYCAPIIGCTPETVIDDLGTVQFNNRGTNYLRYYSKDEAGNTQDTKTTQIFINQLISIGASEYTNYYGNSFDVSITPSDADSSQNLTCALYHRLQGAGGYNSKVMSKNGLNYVATISTSDGYAPLNVVDLYAACNDSMETVNTTAETHSIPNEAPNTPTLISPNDNTVTTSSTIILNYSSSDLDNNTLTYYVYGDANESPPTLIYSGTSKSYNWTLTRNDNGLQNNYWKVLASDGYENSLVSEIRDVIVNDTKGLSVTDPVDKETNRTVNAEYTITITNNGAVSDTYSLTLENLNSASTALLNQSSIALRAGETGTVKLTITDDDTVGKYTVNVTATSNSDAGISQEISMTTTVYGILITSLTGPSGSEPGIYFEGLNITFSGNVKDELNNPVSGATTIFSPIYSQYVYFCANILDLGGGQYNCTMNTGGMQTTHYYNVRVNASKQYYHSGSSVNNTVFLLSVNHEANLTLSKLPTISVLNDTTIVYDISNVLAVTKGSSQSTVLNDIDAGQSWSLGNLAGETATESYTLSYARGNNAYLITLNKSNASGYDPVYSNNLFAESNQPMIVIPENETLNQITLIKNLIYQNQTTTNVTYQIAVNVINSGDSDLTDIEVTDTDIDLDTAIDLKEGESWQASSYMLIEKNPQTYTKTFVKTRASAAGIFYSNQPSITIPGYGGPFDVIITSLPSFAYTGNTITGTVRAINQNTEVAEDRLLTTWIEDLDGNVMDIDIRTVYVGRGESLDTNVTLTVPSGTGTYYFKSELVWPTATANATKSFGVFSPPSGGGSTGVIAAEGGAAPQNITAICGDSICSAKEAQNQASECLADCGYDCNGDGKGDSWTRCIITVTQMPEDIKQDLMRLKSKINQLENEIAKLNEEGADTLEIENLVSDLKKTISESEKKISEGEYDYARNLLKNAYVDAGTTIIVKSPTGKTIAGPLQPMAKFLKLDISWKFVILTLIIASALVIIIGGIYYRHKNEAEQLALLKRKRQSLERLNRVVDDKINRFIKK